MYMKDEAGTLQLSYPSRNMVFIVLFSLIILILGLKPGFLIEVVDMAANSIL